MKATRGFSSSSRAPPAEQQDREIGFICSLAIVEPVLLMFGAGNRHMVSFVCVTQVRVCSIHALEPRQ